MCNTFANYAYKRSSGTSDIFSRAEAKNANKTSSLNSVATDVFNVFRGILELAVVAVLVSSFLRSLSPTGQPFISGKSGEFVFFVVSSFRLIL